MTQAQHQKIGHLTMLKYLIGFIFLIVGVGALALILGLILLERIEEDEE